MRSSERSLLTGTLCQSLPLAYLFAFAIVGRPHGLRRTGEHAKAEISDWPAKRFGGARVTWVSVSGVTEEANLLVGMRPRALIVTVYGLYARRTDGWLSIHSLIVLMAELGVDEPAVRSSISRLKRRDILEAQRRDGGAGYVLSPHARVILDEGDRRIFQRHRATLGEGWVLAVFSVPESARRQRNVLRSRLSWLGFGTVGSGVWIAPGHIEDETRDVLRRHQLSRYVDLFHANYLGLHDIREQVATWWDLDGLGRLYADFSATYGPVLAKWQRHRTGLEDSAAFVDYVHTLTTWRRLPFLDPGLATELLPQNWMGARAADTFSALHERLKEPANRYVRVQTQPKSKP